MEHHPACFNMYITRVCLHSQNCGLNISLQHVDWGQHVSRERSKRTLRKVSETRSQTTMLHLLGLNDKQHALGAMSYTAMSCATLEH